MKPHRLYLISGRVEVRVRSIALITCWMTNEAVQEPKEGKQEMRRSRKVRKRNSWRVAVKVALKMDAGRIYSQTEGQALIIVSPDAVTPLIFYTFIHFLLLPLFLESTTRDCTSLEGLINESTQQRQ